MKKAAMILKAAIVLPGALVAACSSMPDPEPVISDVSSFQSPAIQRTLAAGDRVKIIVFGSDKVSGDYRLDASGRLALNGYGKVQAAGLTTRQLEEQIAALMASKGIPDARVSVLAEEG